MKVVNLTGFNSTVGLSFPGGFRNNQRRAMGQEQKLLNQQTSWLLLKQMGTATALLFWDWTHFGWRQWLKDLKMITVGAEMPFIHSCSASWAFCAFWEDSGPFQHQAWSFWGWNFPGSFFKFSKFLIYNYHTAKHCADIMLFLPSANLWVGWFAYSHFQHFKIDWKYVLLYK